MLNYHCWLTHFELKHRERARKFYARIIQMENVKKRDSVLRQVCAARDRPEMYLYVNRTCEYPRLLDLDNEPIEF